MPNDTQLELPLKTYTCTWRRYMISREAGDMAPPNDFAPLAKHQWYRWEALYELIRDLEALDYALKGTPLDE